MPIDPLPSISRSDSNFRTQVDDLFLTRLPAFSTQAEAARLQIVAAESTTTSAASTATTAATTATTAAGTATSASSSAVTAKNAAEAAAANAISTPVAAPIHAATAKTTPADADELGITDSAATWGLKKITFEALKEWIGSLFVSKAAAGIDGNLNFSGTGRRITADFSNVTIANRAIFQTSTTNSTTSIYAIPNGTGTASRFSTSNASNPDNAGEFSIVASATEARLESTLRGTGAYLPMTTYVGGFKNTEQPVAGGFLVTSAAGLGYDTGAGGTVTQATSKSTPVTLNKPCGLITMNNAALAAGGTALFTFSNSLIGAGDVLFLQLDSTGIASTADYNVWSSGGAGAAVVALKNISAGSLSEAVRLRFVVIKGAQS